MVISFVGLFTMSKINYLNVPVLLRLKLWTKRIRFLVCFPLLKSNIVNLRTHSPKAWHPPDPKHIFGVFRLLNVVFNPKFHFNRCYWYLLKTPLCLSPQRGNTLYFHIYVESTSGMRISAHHCDVPEQSKFSYSPIKRSF